MNFPQMNCALKINKIFPFYTVYEYFSLLMKLTVKLKPSLLLNVFDHSLSNKSAPSCCYYVLHS